MIERRQHLRLAGETLHALGILCKPLGEHLECYLAAELCILGPIDLTHPALTQLGGNLEVRECLADQSEWILSAEGPARVSVYLCSGNLDLVVVDVAPKEEPAYDRNCDNSFEIRVGIAKTEVSSSEL